MKQSEWNAVDDFIVDRLSLTDQHLEATLAASENAGLPAYEVSPALGKFLNLVVRMSGARRVLEIGTLGGYSTLWLARGLPEGGAVVSLEADPYHAKVASKNIDDAGLSARVDIHVGPALDTLPIIEADGMGPFDLVFIDADKPSNPDYLSWALKLSRSGTIIIVDNVVRYGAVTDFGSHTDGIKGTDRGDDEGARHMLDCIAAEPRLSATTIQTVGSKGWDGFAIAIVD